MNFGESAPAARFLFGIIVAGGAELMPATVWRGNLVFGMVSIPVRLHKAARRERIHFHHVYRPVDTPQMGESVYDSESPEAPAPKGRVQEFPKPTAAEAPAPEPVARVRNLPIAEVTEHPIERTQVLKGYEIERDRYVTF